MEAKIVNIEKCIAQNSEKRVPVPPPTGRLSRPPSEHRIRRAPTPTLPLNGQTYHLNIEDEIRATPDIYKALPGKKLRRVQSAHAMLTSQLHQAEVTTLSNGILKQTVFSFGPQSRRKSDNLDKAKDPDRKVKIIEPDPPPSPKKKNSEEKKKKKKQKRRPVSAPAITEAPSPQLPPPTAFLEPVVVSCKTGEQICGEQRKDDERTEEIPKWEELDGLTIDDLIDYDDDDYREEHTKRSIPKTLRPLLTHLTEDIPSIMTGIDASRCLIFLPSMNIYEAMTLPVVPAPQDADEELMYVEKIPAPRPEPKPKRYKHPWTPLPKETHKCNHNSKERMTKDLNATTSLLQFFSESGDLLMETPRGQRNTTVVRQEIRELEDLMQGVGTSDGCCSLVRYQADINQLQAMLRDTMPRVEEVERKIAEKEAHEYTDFFGLKAFYKEHDEVMEQIKTKYANCIQELKMLETGFTSCNEGCADSAAAK